MHGTDARAGKHCDGGLGNHREIDDRAVALLEPVSLEDIGEATDIAVKLLVSDDALLARLIVTGGLAFPDDRGLVRRGSIEPFVEAVGADIELATDEPLRDGLLPLENLLPRLQPDELVLRLLRPELFRRLDGLVIHLAILGHRLDVGALGEILGGMKHPLLVHIGRDINRRRGGAVRFRRVASGRLFLLSHKFRQDVGRILGMVRGASNQSS